MRPVFKGNTVLFALRGVLTFLAAVCFVLPASAFTTEELNTIAVYEESAPSVVNITTMACGPEYFFCTIPTEQGSGSGVVLSEDGVIVTNSHVISGTESIQVTLADGRRLGAKLVASSPADDIAVIRVDPGGKPLKAITLGDSDKLEIGEKVLAIGNPFGLGQTLTTGVVSMKGRSLRDTGGHVMRDMVQTNAPINPGNSGGALINTDGELVGINTAILSPTGANVGVGFAISVNRMKQVAPGLMKPWGKLLGWLLAILLVTWFARRIYRF
jgi:S1-C subfamily serine protease